MTTREKTSSIEAMADQLVDSTGSFEAVSNPAIAFILILGRALHTYGTPAHRLEAALSRVADHLGLKGQFFSTPTSLFAAFGELDQQRTYLIRVEPGSINLDKLVQLDMVLDEVGGGELDLLAAIKHVQEVVNAPRRYGPVMETLGFAVIGGGAASFFGGSYLDIALAMFLGLPIGVLGIFILRTPNSARLFETLAGLTASLGAIIGAWLLWSGFHSHRHRERHHCAPARPDAHPGHERTVHPQLCFGFGAIVWLDDGLHRPGPGGGGGISDRSIHPH